MSLLPNDQSSTKTYSKHLSYRPAPFNPPLWLSNSHVQTILPKFIQPDLPVYRRKLALDYDEVSEVAYDFVDADETLSDEKAKYKTPLLVLFHGMEGSSDSHYARILAHYAQSQGWHFVVGHFRTCGGVTVPDDVVYHAGDSVETHHMLQLIASRYDTIHAVGVSLGGNLLAKYMSDYGDNALCESATIISAPLDLISATTAMQTFIGRKVYTPYLLNPMLNKVLGQQLDIIELSKVEATRCITEFDEAFTVPRLGYRSPYDYYRQASALPHIHKIKKPALIITAQDDPFLGIKPTVGDISNSTILCEPKHGGHIGFVRWKDNRLDLQWIPETIFQFIDSLSSTETDA